MCNPSTPTNSIHPIIYECAQCEEDFSEFKDLEDHVRESHNAEHKNKCKSAHKRLRNLRRLKSPQFSVLEEHEEKEEKKTDIAGSKYVCKVCGNSFSGHSNLSAHKRLHKERPFKCDQCDKAYPRKVELQIHMRTHTGELPYACHLCDKRFAIKVRLTYHLQKHEGVTHPCTYCEAVYDNRNKLKAHLFKHTGMPYKCELCPGIGFERRLRFANHMQRFHQKTLSEKELGEIFAKNTGKTTHFKKPESKEITTS